MLSPSRPYNQLPGHIPLSEIKAYIELLPYPLGDIERFILLIQSCDVAYVKTVVKAIDSK